MHRNRQATHNSEHHGKGTITIGGQIVSWALDFGRVASHNRLTRPVAQFIQKWYGPTHESPRGWQGQGECLNEAWKCFTNRTEDWPMPTTCRENTELSATASGGTPPYTICFDTSETRGSLAEDASFIATGPDIECRTASPNNGENALQVARTYVAPSIGGADSITVSVTDSVGAKAIATISLDISAGPGAACGAK